MFAVAKRNPNFRRLWTAQAISQLGDWFHRIAVLSLIGTLSTTEDGHGAVGIGLFFALEIAARFLPGTLFGGLAGPLADRLPRRALMIGTDLARAFVVLGFFLIDEPGELPWLYVLLVVQTGLSLTFEAARAGALPNTVPKEDLHAAHALSSATWSLMLSVGSLAGGIALEALGLRAVFAIDAASYLVSAYLLTRLPLPPTPKQPRPLAWRDVLLYKDLGRAFAHARGRGVGAALLTKGAWGGAGGFLVLLALAAESRASLPGATLGAGFLTGLFYALRGLGTVAGPYLAAGVYGRGPKAFRKHILSGFLLGPLGYLAFVSVDPLWLAIPAIMLAHAGGSMLWVGSTAWWQQAVDDAFRGRSHAGEHLLMMLGSALGALATGLAYDLSGSLFVGAATASGLVFAGGGAWAIATHRAAARPLTAPD